MAGRTTHHLTALLVVALSACGGTQGNPQSGTPLTAGTAGDESPSKTGGGKGHAELPPTVSDFHDTMAPIWHAEKKRAAVACDRVDTLDTRAQSVQKAPTPGDVDDAPKWRKATLALVSAVHELSKACDREDAGTANAKMGEVHRAFHGLMKRLEARR
jgi:hypothetical protein